MHNNNSEQIPGINPVLRSIVRRLHEIRKPFLERKVRQLTLEYVCDVPLLALPYTLNAGIFRGGEFLARVVEGHKYACPLPSIVNPLALDMGTGTGVGAVFAARRGYKVIGVDINPEAVRCARINVLLNNLEEKIDIRPGDLFEPVSEEQFDLITFNPPWFRGEPKNLFDLAWRSNDVMERFAEGLPDRLTETGRALILLSTDGDGAGMLNALKRNKLHVESIAQHHFGNEIMIVYMATKVKIEK